MSDKLANFIKGRINVPWMVRGDAYTVAGEVLASPQARAKSVYNYTNRYSPAKGFPEVAKDSRMVFYGLSEFIRNHLTKPITYNDIDQAENFMADAHSLGGPLAFNRKPWERIVKEYMGFLPIKIEALSEGSTFFPNEPVIQVTSLDEGFGEIAAIIEALLVGMVSCATARVTVCRHWLERIKEWCKLEDNEAMAQFIIHDFGMRASSCSEESELLGKAHLLVFHGTDTFNAAYQAMQIGAKRPTGTSILALAHRIVQGYDSEKEAYSNLSEQDKIGSYVSDCYNYKKAVENYLIPLAKSNSTKMVVNRPDSGDFLDNTLYHVNKAVEHGLFKQPDGQNIPFGMVEPTNFKFINGDSMNPNKVTLIYRELMQHGYSPTKWGIFGVGGYLRNAANRDILSSAYKLAAKGTELEPVIKLSDTPSKMSIPGPTVIRRHNCNGHVRPTVFLENEYHTFGESAYRTYYNGANPFSYSELFGEACIEDFSILQERTIANFNGFAEFSAKHPEFGLANDSCLSDKIKDLQKGMLEKYRR